MQQSVSFSELFVRFRYVRRNSNGLREVGHGLFRLILVQVKVRELNEWLGIFGRAFRLPGNGVLEGLDGFIGPPEGLIGQSHVIFRFHIPGLEF